MKTKLAVTLVTVLLAAIITIGLIQGTLPTPNASALSSLAQTTSSSSSVSPTSTPSTIPTQSPSPTPSPTPIPSVEPPPISPGYQLIFSVSGNATEDTDFFTVSSTNWEIRWAYTPLNSSASFNVVVNPTETLAISKTGDLGTKGTVYMTNNNQPWYYFTISCSDVQDYTLLIDQQIPQPTPTPSSTPTPTPSVSPSPTPQPTPTLTPMPTATPDPTPVPTATISPTPTPSSTPTVMPTVTPTSTPASTITPTPTNQTLIIPDYTNPPSQSANQINLIGVGILVAFIIGCAVVTVFLRIKQKKDAKAL